MQGDRLYFFIFATIHDVLKAEKILKGSALDIEVVPVPRALSSDCGVCIKSGEKRDVIAGLIGHMTGVRCFVFDGIEYEPETTPGLAV